MISSWSFLLTYMQLPRIGGWSNISGKSRRTWQIGELPEKRNRPRVKMALKQLLHEDGDEWLNNALIGFSVSLKWCEGSALHWFNWAGSGFALKMRVGSALRMRIWLGFWIRFHFDNADPDLSEQNDTHKVKILSFWSFIRYNLKKKAPGSTST